MPIDLYDVTQYRISSLVEKVFAATLIAPICGGQPRGVVLHVIFITLQPRGFTHAARSIHILADMYERLIRIA